MSSKFDPACIVAAVDLGGTAVKIGIVNGAGDILGEKSIPTNSYEGPERVLERVAGTVMELRSQLGVEVQGLGFGAPGLIDVKEGIIRFSPNLGPKWNDFPVRRFLEPLVGTGVRVMNDARAATLAELNFGPGHGTDETMILIVIGTGLGGGIVVDGKLRLGAFGAAGEIGHIIVKPHGRKCGCGNSGCLETYVSGPALAGEGVRLMRSGQAPILNKIVNGDPGKVEAKTMAQAVEAGDKAIEGAVQEMVDYLAIGVSGLIHAIHPESIVIGGGVANLGEILFKSLREKVAQYVTIFPTDAIRIVPSNLGDRTGLLGAAALALNDEY